MVKILELIRQKSKLERLAKKNQLSQQDLFFLREVEDIFQKYLTFIERLRELNRQDFRL